MLIDIDTWYRMPKITKYVNVIHLYHHGSLSVGQSPVMRSTSTCDLKPRATTSFTTDVYSRPTRVPSSSGVFAIIVFVLHINWCLLNFGLCSHFEACRRTAMKPAWTRRIYTSTHLAYTEMQVLIVSPPPPDMMAPVANHRQLFNFPFSNDSFVRISAVRKSRTLSAFIGNFPLFRLRPIIAVTELEVEFLILSGLQADGKPLRPTQNLCVRPSIDFIHPFICGCAKQGWRWCCSGYMFSVHRSAHHFPAMRRTIYFLYKWAFR